MQNQEYDPSKRIKEATTYTTEDPVGGPGERNAYGQLVAEMHELAGSFRYTYDNPPTDTEILEFINSLRAQVREFKEIHGQKPTGGWLYEPR